MSPTHHHMLAHAYHSLRPPKIGLLTKMRLNATYLSRLLRLEILISISLTHIWPPTITHMSLSHSHTLLLAHASWTKMLILSWKKLTLDKNILLIITQTHTSHSLTQMIAHAYHLNPPTWPPILWLFHTYLKNKMQLVSRMPWTSDL